MTIEIPPKIIISENAVEELKSELEISNIITDPSEIPIEQFVNAIGLKTIREMALSSLFSTDHFTFEDNRVKIKSNVDIRQIAGHVFENFIVNLIRIDTSIGAKFLWWSTGYNPSNYNVSKQYDSYFQFYYGIRTIVKSSSHIKDWDTNKYCHTSKDDVAFYVRSPVDSERSHCIGGFQVKAIQGNERDKIINPILKNEYTNVITLLQNEKGEHSYQRCLNILSKLEADGEITHEEAQTAKKKIGYPKMFGISQELINFVYENLMELERKGLKKKKLTSPILEGMIAYAQETSEDGSYVISEGNKIPIIQKKKS
ncbi:hypothetical protein Elgi_68700 [Paenibacillus elgii]|uniref:hypothetical protein n=1 Tax=Paenibacillus elgii TaxID=189691 RepID=UPI002D7CD6F1|nr:hypothetical protein Elgi_68700 [Paenibacillus elgii]